MKKLLVGLVVLLMSLGANAQQLPPRPLQECAAQVPHGWPQMQLASGTGICRQAYVLFHDNHSRIPAWVAYTLTPPHALGCVVRSNAFQADASLPLGQRSEPRDFVGSGYDIGHLAPSGDMSWNRIVERESFIMSNMAPQLPGLNRSTWKLLETYIREWTFTTGHTFTIYVGPIYNGSDPKIGVNQVTVPHAFYKIVIDNNIRQIAGWVMPQAERLGTDLTKFRVSIAQIQQRTGIAFAFPPGGTELDASSMWPLNNKGFITQKRTVCRVGSLSN